MGGIGVTGIILLVLVALLLFGPNKLPELGRALGRTLREFKAGANDVFNEADRNEKDSKRVEASSTEIKEQDNKRLPD